MLDFAQNREQDRLDLARELKSEACVRVFQKLLSENPVFNSFTDWEALELRISKGRTRNALLEDILPPLIESQQESLDPSWPTIMLSLFWRRLDRLWKSKRHWDVDKEELWHRIIREFLIRIRKLDPNDQPERLVKRLVNGTANRVYRKYFIDWRTEEFESPSDPETLLQQERKNAKSRMDPVQAASCFDGTVAWVKGAYNLSEIEDKDLELLINSRVHGYSIRELARKLKVNYDALKKRRLRMEARLRAKNNPQKSEQVSLLAPPSCTL